MRVRKTLISLPPNLEDITSVKRFLAKLLERLNIDWQNKDKLKQIELPKNLPLKSNASNEDIIKAVNELYEYLEELKKWI